MTYSYLALGDSYTIGEQVLPEDNFPHQVVNILKKGGVTLTDPLIIAKTGWTTDELDAAIDEAKISTHFNIVSLLIGVNNQYRGRSVSEYKVQFDHLLQRAIGFAAGKISRVFVLSIPDWGVTPFAEGRDRPAVAAAIDAYNAAAKDICEQHKVVYIDITDSQRTDGNKQEFLAPDGLHPSGKEYSKWALKLSGAIKRSIA
jgi:lysophospholipase L1-like esterase